jgi:polyisoprenoid-binding protein YceI
MKTLIGVIILIIVIGGGYYLVTQGNPAPGNTETENEAGTQLAGTVPSQGSYEVSPSESRVEWTAGKPGIIGYVHHGTFPVADGEIVVGDNTASGSFALDMTGLRVTSLGGGKAGRESQLEGHLKTGDFFDVDEYPTAMFEISSVTAAPAGGFTITGDLTIKGTTEEVSFPAHIVEENGKLMANAEFTIDRTRWDVTFGSANFFEDLAENAIGDEVTITLSLVANKAQ